MAGGARRDAEPGRLERRATVLGVAVAVYGLAYLFVRQPVSAVTGSEPFDLDINLVGARRMLEGRDIYDTAASRAEGVRHVSVALRSAYHDTFSSFVGAPAVAALHAPLTLLPRADAIASARILDLLCILVAVAFVVAALPRRSRVVGTLVGTGALALSHPLIAATQFGQLHGLVMLGLAVAIWGVATERWSAAGMGLGLATVLKVSPVLLIVYLGFRVGRRILVPALATVVSLSAVAALVGVPSALVVWIRDIVPSLSGGTRYVRNQSLPAFLARLTGSNDLVKQVPLGTFRFIGPCLALGLGYAIFRMCRRRGPLRPVELGALILVVLVAGPLSWDHYYVWAVISVVTLCDIELWSPLSSSARSASIGCCVVALFLLSLPFHAPSPRDVAATWLLRVTGSPTVVGGALLLVVAMVLLRAQPKARPPDFVLVPGHLSRFAQPVDA